MVDDNTKTCFVISPIDEPDTDTRKRSDQILRHIISPAVEAKGYKTPLRADEISEPGIITSQVIQHVVDDDLVIADLTERNPNVFYELAVRHAIRKPFIQLIGQGESIPFDVASTRTIIVDHHDLDNVDRAKKEIEEQIDSLESDSTALETPISVSLDLQYLRRSEDPRERSLGDVLSEVSGMRSLLAELVERMSAGSEGILNRREVRHLEERITQVLHETVLRGGNSLRSRQQDPFNVVEVARAAVAGAGSDIAIPIWLGYLREELPWIYELGMEGYRFYKASKDPGRQNMLRILMQSIDIARSTMDDRSHLQIAVNELMEAIRATIQGSTESRTARRRSPEDDLPF